MSNSEAAGVADQQRLADEMVREQIELDRRLERERAEQDKTLRDKALADRLNAWCRGEAHPGDEELPPPAQEQGWKRRALPPERREEAKATLERQRERGVVIDHRAGVAGGDYAERALQAEKSFRERQQQLADQIEGAAGTDRDRLEALKAAEYHSHRADQHEAIAHLAKLSDGGHGDQTDWIEKHRTEAEDHRQQAEAAAMRLDELSRQKAEAARFNPAAERAAARMAEAQQRTPQPATPEQEEQIRQMREARERLEATRAERRSQPDESARLRR